MEKTSRRTFLQTATMAGLAATLPSSGAFGNETQTAGEALPAAPDRDLIFLFQGNSITDGNRGRSKDPNHILGHGYQSIVSSRIGADFPGNNFTFYNRGISGNRIPNLQQRWQTDTLDLKPNVLSILIGINDASAIMKRQDSDTAIDEYETGYRDILSRSKAQNPETIFVLCLPFVYPVGRTAETIDTYRSIVNKQTARIGKLAKEFNALIVDFPSVFEKAKSKAPIEYWNWDGIHPTVFGHDLMAREWIRTVSTRLKFLNYYKNHL